LNQKQTVGKKRMAVPPSKLIGPILLVTDLSPRCDRAMDRAAIMAKLHQVKLIVLHVVETPWLTKLAQPAWRSMQAEQQAIAQQQVRQDLKNVDVEFDVRVESGNPIDVICAVAAELGCGLIVTGTAREETLGRMVIGTTVERLARRCDTPLLIVRMRPFKPYDKIAIATDFSEGSRHALETAIDLLPQAQLALFHAFDEVAGIYDLDEPTVKEQCAIRQKLALGFAESTQALKGKPMPTIVVEHGSAEQGLPSYVSTHEIELVVLGTHGVTGLVRTAMGSVAEKILSALRCDALVVRQPHTPDT
jgi:nucleotide-binding universal stress UspA family protein